MIEVLDQNGNRKPPLRADMGPLTVMSAPWTAYWRGFSIGVTPTSCKFLYRLVKANGEIVPHGEFDLLLREEAGWNSVAVHMSMIRRVFNRREIPLLIVNYRARGYRLEWRSQ